MYGRLTDLRQSAHSWDTDISPSGYFSSTCWKSAPHFASNNSAVYFSGKPASSIFSISRRTAARDGRLFRQQITAYFLDHFYFLRGEIRDGTGEDVEDCQFFFTDFLA